MNEITNKIYQYLRTKARFNSLYGKIVLPTIRQSKEVLDLNIEQVEDAYQDLLEYGIIEQISEYQFSTGLQFNIPDKLKNKMRLGY